MGKSLDDFGFDGVGVEDLFGQVAVVLKVVDDGDWFVDGGELVAHFAEDQSQSVHVHLFIVRLVLLLFWTQISTRPDFCR